MKTMLTAALAALAAMGLSARPASAGAFGLFTCPSCCGCCGGCNFCVRPYNAFSPVCSGTLFCDGCMPFGSCGPGCLNYGGLPACGYPGCLNGSCSGCMNGSCSAQMPPMGVMPAAPAGPDLQSLPSPMPKGPPTTSAAYGQSGVYSAGYFPAYYPGYGYGYGPSAGAYGPATAPAYWNGR